MLQAHKIVVSINVDRRTKDWDQRRGHLPDGHPRRALPQSPPRRHFQVMSRGWVKLFENPVIADAIVDWLIHPSQKITLKGEKSYREKLTERTSGLKNDRELR